MDQRAESGYLRHMGHEGLQNIYHDGQNFWRLILGNGTAGCPAGRVEFFVGFFMEEES
jgi:hypothetical protein